MIPFLKYITHTHTNTDAHGCSHSRAHSRQHSVHKAHRHIMYYMDFVSNSNGTWNRYILYYSRMSNIQSVTRFMTLLYPTQSRIQITLCIPGCTMPAIWIDKPDTHMRLTSGNPYFYLRRIGRTNELDNPISNMNIYPIQTPLLQLGCADVVVHVCVLSSIGFGREHVSPVSHSQMTESDEKPQFIAFVTQSTIFSI